MEQQDLMELDTSTAGEPRSERVSTHRVGASMTSTTHLADSDLKRINDQSTSSSAVFSGFRSFKRASHLKPALPSFDSPVGVTPQPGTASWSTGSAAAFSFARTFKRPKKMSHDEISSASQPERGTLIASDAGRSMVPNDARGACPCDSVHGTDDITRGMALLKSPTKGAASTELAPISHQSHALCSLPAASMVPYGAIAPFGASAAIVFGNGTRLTKEELQEMKNTQRQSGGLYKPDFFFPSLGRTIGANLTDSDRNDRQSLRRAIRYVCIGTFGCRVGDCLAALQESDVLRFRLSSEQRRMGPKGTTFSWKQIMTQDLQRCWNRTTETWEPISVSLDEATSVNLCPAAYCLLCGCASSTCREVIDLIKRSEVQGGQLARVVPTAPSNSVADARERRSEDWRLLRAYVADLLDKHEANPAPGAHQPGRMTHITKATWKSKWDATRLFFKDAPRVPGSKSMLKNVWRLETRLKEKKACSHSKCNVCSKIDSNMDALRGVNTLKAQNDRDNNRRAQAEHDEMHLGSRMELDTAGLHAFVNPRHMWTILVDAATQRNFMLPKFKFRVPKKLAGRPFWSYKLMASYAYGYGFTPFLVHSSQHMGANLTWTVLWETLCAMRKHYGYWPSVLHVTVDNTTGENKNETLLAMCAWLVAVGYVKQVRVLFLMVGHTHVIIDHIFGVVTVGLRRKELLVPEDLVQNIDASLAANPQYMAKRVQFLHCLWNFKDWVSKELKPLPITRLFRGNIQDEAGAYSGMYDLLFSSNGTDLPLMKYREHVTHPWLPEASNGVKVISQRPSKPPEFQSIKPWSEWSKDGAKSVKDTILLALDFARSANSSETSKRIALYTWQKHYDLIPNHIDLLNPALKLKFQFFDDVPDDVPRIGMQGAAGADGTNADRDDSYEEWKKQNIDIRTHPLAIDPVVSSAQTNAEYERKKKALQATLRAGRTHPTPTRGSPILLGDFVLARLQANEGVELYSVTTMDGMQSPYCADLTFRGILYEHVPNPDVSGLFGTFRMKLTLAEGKRQQVRTMVHRDQVVVFNANFEKKTKLLSLRTLRALALAVPDGYPFPARSAIPETHLSFSDDEDSDDEDEANEQTAPANRQNRRARPAAASGRGRGRGRSAGRSGTRRRAQASESSSSDGDEDEIDDDDDEESAESGKESGNGSDDSNEDSDDTGATDLPAVTPPVPLLRGPTVEPKLNSVIALNMRGDPEFLKFKYPVALVYVCSVDPFKVYWFVLPSSQLTSQPASRNKAKPFKTSNKNLTFQKFFKNPNAFKNMRVKPTEAQIVQEWYVSTADRNWIMPIDVPQPADPLQVRMRDQFKVPMEYVIQTLIPACEHASCIHNH